MSEQRRVIEINGVKVDVDLREARTVDTIKVGDRVRVLVKGYGESYSAHSGVVIGFDAFKELPTIIIAYLEVSYSDASVKFLHYNDKTENAEVVGVDKETVEAFDAAEALQALDKKIEKAERTLKDARDQRSYFVENVGKAWGHIEA